MYDTVSMIIAFIISIPLFFMLNAKMDITYLGCGGITVVWGGCFLVSGVISYLMLGILKWVLIGAIVVGIIGFVGGKMKGSKGE